MKKGLFLIIAIVLIAVIGAAVLVACSREFELPNADSFSEKFETFNEDFTTYEVESGSAYKLFSEVYAQFVKDSYTFTEYFSFKANALGGMISPTQQYKQIRKIDGDKIYDTKVTVGTGEGKANLAQKYYYDGAKAYRIDINDSKIVPNKGKGEEIFNVTDYGKFGLDTASSDQIRQNNKVFRERISFYDTTDKKYLSDLHNDKVYKKGDKTYIVLTLDCSPDAMDTFNNATKLEFIRALGVKEADIPTFRIISDTTIKLSIGKVGGVNRIFGMCITEDYEGKAQGLAKTTAHQTYTRLISYEQDKYAINDSDLVFMP